MSLVCITQKLESHVGELKTTQDQAQQELQKLQKEGTEMKRKVKDVKNLLESEKAG